MTTFSKEQISGVVFELPHRYHTTQSLGSGSYGLLCSAFDEINRKYVAIKKIRKNLSFKESAERIYREIRLLKEIQHENVVNMTDTFISPSQHVYIATGLMHMDLQQLLRQEGSLEDRLTQFFLYQMMRGVKYIHSAGIVHRDLKPSNIFINENCGLKIGDFGLARHCAAHMTGKVTTRFYRAPEVMLTPGMYGLEVDIWGSACIFAEMMNGKILFPGESDMGQLLMIWELFGKDGKRTGTPSNIREKDKGPLRAKTDTVSHSLRDKFAGVNPYAIDLFEKMLVLEPQHRLSAAHALAHEYLSLYHESADEHAAGGAFYWASNDSIPPDYWQIMIRTEILSFHGI